MKWCSSHSDTTISPGFQWLSGESRADVQGRYEAREGWNIEYASLLFVTEIPDHTTQFHRKLTSRVDNGL